MAYTVVQAVIKAISQRNEERANFNSLWFRETDLNT